MERARSLNPGSKQNTYLPQSKKPFSKAHCIKTVISLGQKKKRILKAAREKNKATYKGKPVKLSDFSEETLQDRREWDQIFKLLKERNYQPRIIYPAKLSFRHKREIKYFPDIQKS